MDGLKQGPSLELHPITQKDEDVVQGSVTEITPNSQSLHRSLRGKEVQLFAIGGAIGTCKLGLSHTNPAFLEDD
jgi:amino acid transporter